MSPPGTDLVEPLDWDSAFWGVAAARVHADDADGLLRAVADCDRSGVVWGSLLVPTEDLDLVVAAIETGFVPVDVRVTLAACVTDSDLSTGPSDQHLADESDVDALATIARDALTMSRFFADPNLPDARCADFYETWIRNSVGGPLADAVIVERGDDGIDGFITIRRSTVDDATLPLVAVSPGRQGRGIGRAMLASTQRWLVANDVRRVEVTTQLANVPAIRLYEAHGFRVDRSGIWLHRWSPDAGAAA
jgi:dTDP-4-amino-4,6-dideoxy-D-galactose acyltransferase